MPDGTPLEAQREADGVSSWIPSARSGPASRCDSRSLERAMRDGLEFTVDWTDADVSPTAARIKIDVAGANACRSENLWSRTLDDAPHVDAMPLALWMAQSWWRLRWEGKPETHSRQNSWRMAHELSAAGGGFLWPRVSFTSDQEAVFVKCQPTPIESAKSFAISRILKRLYLPLPSKQASMHLFL